MSLELIPASHSSGDTIRQFQASLSVLGAWGNSTAFPSQLSRSFLLFPRASFSLSVSWLRFLGSNLALFRWSRAWIWTWVLDCNKGLLPRGAWSLPCVYSLSPSLDPSAYTTTRLWGSLLEGPDCVIFILQYKMSGVTLGMSQRLNEYIIE